LGFSGIKPVTPNVDCVRPTIRSNHSGRKLDFRVIECHDMCSVTSRKSINCPSPLCRVATNNLDYSSDATLSKPSLTTDQIGITRNCSNSRKSTFCASSSRDDLSDDNGNTSYVSETSDPEQRNFTSDDIRFIRSTESSCGSEGRVENISQIEEVRFVHALLLENR
jgi:hypothetical protein